ncbi:MAG: glycosyltransferase [Planctomycetota bacterium]
MRIALLITELEVGGAEKTLTELAVGLTHRGHAVRVLAIASPPATGRDGLVETMRGEKIELHFGGFDRASQAFSAKRWIETQHRQFAPDVSQTFLFHANTLGEAAARRVGVAVRVGGLRVAEPKPVRLWLEKRAIRGMSHLVCVSRDVKQFALDRLGARRDRCSVIPNGVKVDRFDEAAPVEWADFGWPTDCRVALFIGRFHPQKGLDLIRQQADSILQQDPSRRLLLIGDGPLRAELEAWSAQAALRSSSDDKPIRVLPWQADVAPFLKSASLLLLPSRYEGMPNVVLEAMAAGLPVVCSRVEGASELLGDDQEERGKRQGFQRGNAIEMTEKANTILSDDALANRLGTSNRQFVASHYSYDSMIDAYESLYARLLTESSGEKS